MQNAEHDACEGRDALKRAAEIVTFGVAFTHG